MKSATLVITLAVLSAFAAEAADVFYPGALKREYWPGGTLASVLAGTAGTPTFSLPNFPNAFETPVNFADNYAERVSGFFIPPTTGNYIFIVASDDQGNLYLSTDDQPANKRLIAQEVGWTASRNWITDNGGAANDPQRRSDQFKPAGSTNTPPFATGIPLTANTRYYIEGVHYEGGGGDNFAVFYKLTADPDPVDGDPPNTTGNVIGVLAPSTVSIIGQPASRRVLPGQTVTFSVGADVPIAQFQWFKGTGAIAGETNNTYTTAPLTAADNGATFHAVATAGTSSATSSNAVITIGSTVLVPGAKEEVFSGALRADVEDPGFGTAPDSVVSLSAFETPTNQADNFTDRVTAVFKPQISGNYVFFIASDDDGDLFVSTDATPANKRQVAAETGWSAVRNWNGANGNGAGLTGPQSISQKRSDQWVPDPTAPPPAPPFANGIALVAGNSYYIESVHHEGGGGDNLAVTYKLVGEADPESGDAPKLSGFVLAPFVPALDGAVITVITPPQNTAGIQNRTATFSIVARSGYIGDATSASPGLSYQWQTAPPGSSTFANIPGAGGASYTTPRLSLSDSGRQYRVALLAGDATANSAAGTLTVNPDTTAPRPVTVTSVNPGGTLVTVAFDELMDKASSETGANYSFAPGNVAGSSAVLDASGLNVTITTASALSPNVTNTLTITGVKDLAGVPVAANTTIKFRFDPVTYAANILFDGPLGYYRFEETSGSVATNSGTTGGNGAYYVGNETTPATGEGTTPGTPHGDPGPRPPTFIGFDANNHAATFGGPDTQEWVDTKNKWLHNRNAFTLEYWVAPANRVSDPTAFGTRIGIVGQNDTVEYGFINPTTIEIWTPGGGGAVQVAYSFPDNEWHHVATIADGTLIRNYYDGVLVGTPGGAATSNYGPIDTFNVHIGGGGITDATGNFFTGKIDEVAIFDKAIPAARVAAHYLAGKQGGVITFSGAVTPAAPGLGITVSVARTGGNAAISWTPSGGTLQSTPALSGAATVWTDVGTANPATVTIGTANTFYRVKSP